MRICTYVEFEDVLLPCDVLKGTEPLIRRTRIKKNGPKGSTRINKKKVNKKNKFEDVLLVGVVYLVFTRTPDERHHR